MACVLMFKAWFLINFPIKTSIAMIVRWAEIEIVNLR